MSLAYDVIPVTIVTGFLGSGKSTLLADVLKGDAARDTAVLVNEFGEVGLDHLLIGEVDAQTVLLDNGCVCCAIRGELKEALATLFSRRARGEVPPFSRVVLETTGLATPAPIVATLLRPGGIEPLFDRRDRYGGRCRQRRSATCAASGMACAGDGCGSYCRQQGRSCRRCHARCARTNALTTEPGREHHTPHVRGRCVGRTGPGGERARLRGLRSTLGHARTGVPPGRQSPRGTQRDARAPSRTCGAGSVLH